MTDRIPSTNYMTTPYEDNLKNETNINKLWGYSCFLINGGDPTEIFVQIATKNPMPSFPEWDVKD